MGAHFDRWTLLKVLEVGFTIACIVCKRVTDDEASRLFLYLQKLSREWSLLNNVTWDQIGAAVADATYGGYIIITFALLIGRISGELPTEKRITEMILLGVGALLYIIIGSLEFASLDSVPPDLVDNAAVIGSLTIITALLFLIDLGGPKAKRTSTQSQTLTRSLNTQTEPRSISQQVYDIEQAIEISERKHLDGRDRTTTTATSTKSWQERQWQEKTPKKTKQNGVSQNGYKKPNKEGKRRPKRFDIYGKDAAESGNDSETDVLEDLPPRMKEHSPVWSKVRYGPVWKI